MGGGIKHCKATIHSKLSNNQGSLPLPEKMSADTNFEWPFLGWRDVFRFWHSSLFYVFLFLASKWPAVTRIGRTPSRLPKDQCRPQFLSERVPPMEPTTTMHFPNLSRSHQRRATRNTERTKSVGLRLRMVTQLLHTKATLTLTRNKRRSIERMARRRNTRNRRTNINETNSANDV